MKSRSATASSELGVTPSKPSSRGDHPAVSVEVDAGQRAGAERQVSVLRGGEREALAIARQHPDVGQQVMDEIDGLRALQVRVAGQQPVRCRLAASITPRTSSMRAAARTGLARDMRCRWSPGRCASARCAGAPPARPAISVSAALDGHVDVLVAVLEGKTCRRAARPRRRRAPTAARRGPRRDDLARREHARVRA